MWYPPTKKDSELRLIPVFRRCSKFLLRKASKAEAARTEEDAIKDAAEGRRSGSTLEEGIEAGRLDERKEKGALYACVLSMFNGVC